MGGFGALHVAARQPSSFCAIGSHSPALWHRAGDTPPGAFDDRDDYERTDVWRSARAGAYRAVPVWVDVGDADGFAPVTRAFAAALRKQGVDITTHVWLGGHSRSYWDAHWDEYLAFYADKLAGCSRT